MKIVGNVNNIYYIWRADQFNPVKKKKKIIQFLSCPSITVITNKKLLGSSYYNPSIIIRLYIRL